MKSNAGSGKTAAATSYAPGSTPLIAAASCGIVLVLIEIETSSTVAVTMSSVPTRPARPTFALAATYTGSTAAPIHSGSVMPATLVATMIAIPKQASSMARPMRRLRPSASTVVTPAKPSRFAPPIVIRLTSCSSVVVAVTPGMSFKSPGSACTPRRTSPKEKASAPESERKPSISTSARSTAASTCTSRVKSSATEPPGVASR